MNIRFYLAGNHTPVTRIHDLFCSDKLHATRYYYSTDNYCAYHHNKFTTFVTMDSELFKKHYKYNRKNKYYELTRGFYIDPVDGAINGVKIELFEH